MRRSKAEVDRYISSAQSASPSLKEKPVKGFLFAKLYFEAKEYELAKRHVSAYLTVQERDPKAHKFLGQLYEREENINKAVGCYKRSVDLNPAQRDLVLKVAELLCGKAERDSRADFWVEKAAKLLPGSPAVYNLKEKLLSSQGQQGLNQLFDLLQAELQLRPGNAHINAKLVQLYCSDGRLDEAVTHCLAVEKKGALRSSLDWYSTLVPTLQEYLAQPSVLSNEKLRRKLQKELLLAHCSLLRLSLYELGVQQCVEALQSFDHAMQASVKLAASTVDELSEAFTEMRGHLYLHSGTLLLKMAHTKEQQWRAVTDLAALCYLLAYQVPKPKPKPSKGEQAAQQLVDSLACDRQSQSGHMLLNLSQDNDGFVKEVVEAFGNRSGQGSLFEMLFGAQAPVGPSFIGNDDIRSMGTDTPKFADLIKWDNGAVLLLGGDLQQLVWLGLQWAFMAQKPALRDWLKQLFPRLTLETSKLDTNAPESICLLDLEVFLSGVVFSSQTQLQETQKITASSQLLEPRCLPLQLIKLLSTERQRDWWNAVYSLIHKKSLPGMSAKLRIIVQHGLSTLRAGEKHGLQPALVIHWAQYLSETGGGVNSYYDQKEYVGRSVHYWKVVLPLLEKIKKRRSIPEPLDPLFMHFHSKDIQISEVKSYEDEASFAFAILLDIEGKTEEAIATLENINSISSSWHLAQIFQRLSEEAGSGVEETQEQCIMFLRKFRKYLSKIYNANAAELEKLPVSMEEVMDLLNDVNQQLGETGEVMDEEEEGRPAHSSPNQISQLIEPSASGSHIKLSTPSPTKSVPSPSKRHMFSPKMTPHWAEDQKSLLQRLCQQVEALKNEVHDLRHNSSGATASPHHRMYSEGYAAESLQEPFPAAQSFHGAPLTVATTGPSVYYNASPAYNSQYLLRTTANVTPTKAPVYGINRLPTQQHMYAYQQPTHTPPLQSTPACMYPQDQVYGGPLRFESPATSLLSPYSEEYYSHSVPQPSTNPPLPEPGYFTKPAVVPVQPPKSGEAKPMEFGKISFGQQIPVDPPKVKNNSESLLGLLTSDIPTRSEVQMGQKAPAQDQASTAQGGIFSFGGKGAAGFSFADVAQSQGKTGLFGKTDQPFSFADVTKPGFGVAGGEEHQEEKGESDNESSRIEEDEDGPHFEPIVPLPDKVDVKTGEEEEEMMFCNRAKLFRFETETKEWKERGIGSIKILRHRTSDKVRLLMRREQVLKICANHYITADMVLKPNAGSDKSWVWYAIDYADEMPKPEQLAIRFKTADEAALFKAKFEEAQKFVPKSPQKQDQSVGEEVPPKASAPQATGKESEFGAQFAKKEAGGFKFGTQEPVKPTPPAEGQPDGGSASLFLKNIAEQHREKEEAAAVSTDPPLEGLAQVDNPLFSDKPNTFSFADLAKSSPGDFQFGQSDPNFKGFSRAGEQLFVSLKPGQKADTSRAPDEEDMYRTEDNDDIQFEPVVQMPDKVDLVTGEEDEEVLYSQRIKLFRFDADIGQWKERGVGILKILKNSQNGKLRVLMRREQVFKVCANHLITTTMNLKPLSGSDRAWMWLANDFSDGDTRLEQLAAKFKTPELAEEFKQKFEECQRLLLDIPLQTPHKLVDTGRTARLIQKAEEMKSGLKDLKSFLTDDKAKIKEDESKINIATASNTPGLIIKPPAESSGITLEWDNYDLQEDTLDDTAETSVYASPLASSPEVRKNLFLFGESTAGFSFSFQPIISPSKSPAKLNQSRISVGTNDESETTQEEERDGQYFEPVVPLPDLVDTTTGEENEHIVFSHRAKLYRYDKDLSQWKERGIGDIKILQNYDTKRVRLVMRRDQVLKLCANHWITPNMKLEPMKGSEKAWIWSAFDFTEGTGRVEQLAVRFKLQDVANNFRDVFDEAKNAQETETVLTPVASRETTPHEVICGPAAVAVLEETTRERTDLPPQICHTTEGSTSPATVHSPQNPSKAVVSPPKFVFGTDSVQKIFGSPPSSSELMPTIKTSFKAEAPSVVSASSRAPESCPASQPSIANPTPAMSTFKVPTIAAPEVVREQADPVVNVEEPVEQTSSEDLQIVFVLEPTKEQAQLAHTLNLPPTFFCYQNEPGYVSDDSQDDEDFETAVRKLNGKLYPDPPKRETETPKTVTQETDAPETVTQETDAPETVTQETEAPEAVTQETEAPEAVTQETAAPETVTQETEAPEAVTQESDAPETVTQETDAPETVTQETEAPETVNQESDALETVTQETDALETVTQESDALETVTQETDALETVTQETDALETVTQETDALETVTQETDAPQMVTPETVTQETDAPETVTQETDAPETVTQETDAPETVTQETDAPETVTQETDAPETVTQETDAPETVTQETDAQETVTQETDAPETVTQETDAPETVTQETDTPETVTQKTDAPQAVTLETDAPETVTQETDDPEMVTQETGAPESAAGPPAGERDAECEIVWEKKPTPEEEERAARLQLPLTFFCGAGSDTEAEKDRPDDFEAELRKVQKDLEVQEAGSEVSTSADPTVSSSSDTLAVEEKAAPVPSPVAPQPDSSSDTTSIPTAQDSAPIDLSTKKSPEPDSTSQELPASFGFSGLSTLGGFSFADLAKNTNDFAFGKQDAEFSWANAGATVFGMAPVKRNEGDEEGSDDEDASGNADIHFEPIVSLPEVETKSGEEDEEILFKERTKLYRWDRDVNQWKERGVGDIKILFHPHKRYYRVLMRREQVFKVCANHTISQGMELKPMNTSTNALVWTATDYAEGDAKVEQLAAKFKTAELANSFKRKFEECQIRISQADSSQLSRVLEHSREGNPVVFFCITADGEPLGKITMELFSHIVPKTAENFRALCTGQRGFGFRDSLFHRVVPDFMCQGGDITKKDGTGGKSIFGDKFEDENFDVKHTGPGLLSMANRGRDTNNSQFFITLKKAEHLDFKHVAFGFVKDGMDVVKLMGDIGTKTGKPSKKIVIADCGQLQ
ncbi:hypothetical protein AAFF_G00008530 [Aldrovandia affinis]|uniref:E3 SUMO-protein ligase RanBP2 n=1 Tax=Aldrovandia affinis TaxID=143900 RepID=A0AAD7WZW3_9TELE|nr:hypothetical protein AAFF_G00008530 [Aldrovandia affinis]